MQLPLFFLLIWAICLFHRREHARFEDGMKRLREKLLMPDPKAALKDDDWRLVAADPAKFSLRRAFEVKDRDGILRYAMPPLFFAVLLIFFKSWWFAGVYIAVIAARFFLTVTEVRRNEPLYRVTIFGIKLFEAEII